jgi:hypothetical protein
VSDRPNEWTAPAADRPLVGERTVGRISIPPLSFFFSFSYCARQADRLAEREQTPANRRSDREFRRSLTIGPFPFPPLPSHNIALKVKKKRGLWPNDTFPSSHLSKKEWPMAAQSRDPETRRPIPDGTVGLGASANKRRLHRRDASFFFPPERGSWRPSTGPNALRGDTASSAFFPLFLGRRGHRNGM